jgi:hypothetical protein
MEPIRSSYADRVRSAITADDETPPSPPARFADEAPETQFKRTYDETQEPTEDDPDTPTYASIFGPALGDPIDGPRQRGEFGQRSGNPGVALTLI